MPRNRLLSGSCHAFHGPWPPCSLTLYPWRYFRDIVFSFKKIQPAFPLGIPLLHALFCGSVAVLVATMCSVCKWPLVSSPETPGRFQAQVPPVASADLDGGVCTGHSFPKALSVPLAHRSRFSSFFHCGEDGGGGATGSRLAAARPAASGVLLRAVLRKSAPGISEPDCLFSGRVEPRFVPVEEGLFLGAAGGVRVGTGLRKPPEPPSARPCQVDPDTGYINYDRLEENARLFHPKLIIAGGRPGGRRPRASCRPDGTLSPPILAPCASRQAPVGPCGPVRKLWTWRALAGWGREQPGGRSPRT